MKLVKTNEGVSVLKNNYCVGRLQGDNANENQKL